MSMKTKYSVSSTGVSSALTGLSSRVSSFRNVLLLALYTIGFADETISGFIFECSGNLGYMGLN